MSGFFVPHDLTVPLRGAPDGLLSGLTVAVKDMYDIAGQRTGGGSPDWLAAQKPATRNAAAVQRLLDAGATIVGKTVCDEFFFSLSGVNAHYGTPDNLRAPGRLPGGSSAGSAAATAAGACDVALGSDTGGSVRVPASFCGIYGIRPTLGRMDDAGAMAMAPSFDTPGWFANGPGVLRRIANALLGGTGVAGHVESLILADDAFAEADAPVAAVLMKVIERAGAEVATSVRSRIAPEGFDGWREAFRVIQGREIWEHYGDFVTRAAPKFGPGIKERMAYASTISSTDADAARAVHAKARDHIERLVPPGTVIALPSAPCIAPRLDTSADELEFFRIRAMRLTCVSGLSGLPQVSIPAGTVDGCPVGLSFIGWRGGDEALLDFAVAIARHCGVRGG